MATSKKLAAAAPVVPTAPAKKAPAAKKAAPAKAAVKAPARPVVEKPAAVAKAPAKKAPAAKKATAAKPKAAAKTVSPEQRANYIEVAAFYIAERRGFAPGNPEQDYLDAAAEIDGLIAKGHFSK